jgi:hypothetical protein
VAVFIVNGIYRSTPWHDLMLVNDSYEESLDRIAKYVAGGLILDRVCLVDGGTRMDLPISLFDEPPFGKHMHQEVRELLMIR